MSKKSRPAALRAAARELNYSAPLRSAGAMTPDNAKAETDFEGIVSRIFTPAEKSLAADAIVVFQHVKTLISGLRFAFRDLDNQRDARTMRHRYIAAIMKIADFAHGTAMGDHIAEHLLYLAAAISELDIGIAHPVLRPQKFSNRAPDSVFIWNERARLVCAYELLRASGLTSGAAIKRIREYGNAFDRLRARSRYSGRATLDHSLASWRKAFMGGKVKSAIARARYKRLMEDVNTVKKKGATPSQIDGLARRLLEISKKATADLTASWE